MPEVPVRTRASHLSIGEVLALLLEEFPDVTISKIRFLESQGLIDPERTASGYRKFYDDDVELLRCILREQRENYLPLRVIKDRLDSGEIDPTSEIPRPRGIKNMPDDDEPLTGNNDGTGGASAEAPAELTGAEELFRNTSVPPAETEIVEPAPQAEPAAAASASVTAVPTPDANSGVVMTASELCSQLSISNDALASLESYGVIHAIKGSGGMYGEDAIEIAKIAKQFLDAGFDARHLRGWKVAADREAGLFEQMIQPLVRQRNPQAMEQARRQLNDMEAWGSELRTALMRSTMRHHFDD